MKVKTNFKGVNKKINKLTERGQFILANQVHSDSNRYAPRKSGDLRIISFVTNDNKKIVWSTPYARRQYYGVGIKNYTTPGTGPKWNQKAKAKHLKQWIEIVKKGMR